MRIVERILPKSGSPAGPHQVRGRLGDTPAFSIEAEASRLGLMVGQGHIGVVQNLEARRPGLEAQINVVGLQRQIGRIKAPK